jgi:hypothetical protein
MHQQHEAPTPYVRKIIPLCEFAPLAALGCGWLVTMAGSPRGGLALGLFAFGMWVANLLRDWCQWYSARHPDEPLREGSAGEACQ